MSLHMSPEFAARVREEVKKELEIAHDNGQTPTFLEIGTTGLSRYGGDIQEEFLPHLRWPRAAKIYQEMENNDPVIGAVLYVCEQLVRGVTWKIEPGGETLADEEAVEFLESCMNDMSTTWTDTIAEILTMLSYGFAWHEEVYKKREGNTRDPKTRSKYVDGRIGWRRIPGRAQPTIQGWVFDDSNDGGVKAAIQRAPTDSKERLIPIEKSLLFRTKYRYNNPEGRSLLRNAYRPWYFKKHIEEIEGIGIERDLAGLPVLTSPEGVNLWNRADEEATKLRTHAESLVRNIRRDENEGIVMPFGWDLTLLSTGSRRQFDTNQIINRYDQRIAITLLADIIMLGADKVGSFALSEVKKSMLGASLDAIVKSIADTFNRYAIPRLFRLNVFPGITDYPEIQPQQVMTPDLNELSRYVLALSGANMPLFPDVDLEAYFRGLVGMPRPHERDEEEEEELEEESQVPGEREEEEGGPNFSVPGDGRATNSGNPQSLR